MDKEFRKDGSFNEEVAFKYGGALVFINNGDVVVIGDGDLVVFGDSDVVVIGDRVFSAIVEDAVAVNDVSSFEFFNEKGDSTDMAKSETGFA